MPKNRLYNTCFLLLSVLVFSSCSGHKHVTKNEGAADLAIKKNMPFCCVLRRKRSPILPSTNSLMNGIVCRTNMVGKQNRAWIVLDLFPSSAQKCITKPSVDLLPPFSKRAALFRKKNWKKVI